MLTEDNEDDDYVLENEEIKSTKKPTGNKNRETETEEVRKWRSSKVKVKILNKYTFVQLIVHCLSLTNMQT